MHFTPTFAYWRNTVERSFRSITTDRLERDVLRSASELTAAIGEGICLRNNHPVSVRVDDQGQ